MPTTDPVFLSAASPDISMVRKPIRVRQAPRPIPPPPKKEKKPALNFSPQGVRDHDEDADVTVGDFAEEETGSIVIHESYVDDGGDDISSDGDVSNDESCDDAVSSSSSTSVKEVNYFGSLFVVLIDI